MDLFINISHVVLSILLILVIILQPSKGSDIGAAFGGGGGGGSSTMFGPRGPGSVLSRATTIVAVLFMVTSISLAMRSVPKGGAGTALSDDAGLEGLDDIDLGLDDFDLGVDLDEADETSTEESTDEQSTGEASGEEAQQDAETPVEAAENDAPPAVNAEEPAPLEAGTEPTDEAAE